MREMFKRRVAILLSVLLVLPTVLALLPMARLETEAAGAVSSMSWYFYAGDSAIKVEEGQNFYVGDYVTIYFKSGGYATASMEKAAYSSTSKAVATVDSKGYMKALKTGTTTIKVAYKGKKVSQKFQIVKKGSLTSEEGVQTFRKAAEKLPSALPSAVTTKNGFELQKKQAEFRKAVDRSDLGISFSGMLYSDYTALAVPKAGRAQTLDAMLYQYGNKNNPTGTRGAKVLKISSMSASVKKNEISVTLKSKVTKEQVLAAKIIYAQYNDGKSMKALDDKQAYAGTSVQSGKDYYGVLLLKEGSSKATLKIYNYHYQTNKYKTVRLKKGNTYEVGNAYAWPKGGMRVTAK